MVFQLRKAKEKQDRRWS